MNLEEAMRVVKREVDAELRRFFAKKRKEAARLLHPRGVPQHHPGGEHLMELVDQVADVTLRGGKRIRPFLCWVGYSAVIARSEARQSRANARTQGARSFDSLTLAQDDIKKAMLGLELFQTFAIIHDDIMDEDEERRGGKTIHEYFLESVIPAQAGIQKQKTGSPIRSGMTQPGQRFGESMAILAGDLALAWADELIGDKRYKMKDARPQKRDPYMIYQKMKEEAIYGQTLDVMRSIGVKDIEKGRVDELKTAYYSVVRPLQIGSSLAFKDSLSERLSLLHTWERYGVAAGKLFQLRDDVLDGRVAESVFEKEANVLQRQAHEALGTLETSDEIKKLLVDFIQFVQSRNS